MASNMEWSDFCDRVVLPLDSPQNFFHFVTKSVKENQCWPEFLGEQSHHTWLSLIKTSVLYEWARPSKGGRREWSCLGDESPLDFSPKVFEGVDVRNAPLYEPLLRALLERFLLHLGTRLDPSELIAFWAWLLSGYGLEKQARRAEWEMLPDTIAATSDPRELINQERVFADKLRQVASDLSIDKAPRATWISQILRQIADRRCADTRGADEAYVNVVFGIKSRANQKLSPVLRSGVVVPFRLAGTTQGFPLHGEWHFDPVFSNSVRTAREDLVSDDFCGLTHPWTNVLPTKKEIRDNHIFSDGSGAMAIRVSQFLALGGRSLSARQRTLPSWVIISAAHDPEGPANNGTWRQVELLGEKAQVLIEDGVRMLLTPTDNKENWSGTAEGLLAKQSLARFGKYLSVPAICRSDDVSRGMNHSALANTLRDRGLTMPLHPDFVQKFPRNLHGPLDPGPISDARHFLPTSSIDYQSEYVPPVYIYDRLKAAIRLLQHRQASTPGRGYILWDGPSGLGKTTLMRASQICWPEEFGAVLPYSVLSGRLEHPIDFCHALCDEFRDRFKQRPHFIAINDNIDTLKAANLKLLKGLCEALRALPGEHGTLTIAIDGANYVGTEGGYTYNLLDILPRPSELPDGCFIILSTISSQVEAVKNRLAASIDGIELSRDSTNFIHVPFDDTGSRENIALLRQYFKKQTTLPQVEIDRLLVHSQHSFLYASLLIDILKVSGIGLTDTSQSIWYQYLQFLRDRVRPISESNSLRSGSQETFDRWHKPILCLIAAAQEPLTVDHLLAWLGHLGQPDEDVRRETVHLALEELRKLLRFDQRPDDGHRTVCLGHEQLYSYMQKPSHDWAIQLAAAHCSIVNYSDADCSLSGHSTVNRYCWLHQPTHLLALRRYSDAQQSLRQRVRQRDGSPEEFAVRCDQYAQLIDHFVPALSDAYQDAYIGMSWVNQKCEELITNRWYGAIELLDAWTFCAMRWQRKFISCPRPFSWEAIASINRATANRKLILRRCNPSEALGLAATEFVIAINLIGRMRERCTADGVRVLSQMILGLADDVSLAYRDSGVRHVFPNLAHFRNSETSSPIDIHDFPPPDAEKRLWWAHSRYLIVEELMKAQVQGRSELEIAQALNVDDMLVKYVTIPHAATWENEWFASPSQCESVGTLPRDEHKQSDLKTMALSALHRAKNERLLGFDDAEAATREHALKLLRMVYPIQRTASLGYDRAFAGLLSRELLELSERSTSGELSLLRDEILHEARLAGPQLGMLPALYTQIELALSQVDNRDFDKASETLIAAMFSITQAAPNDGNGNLVSHWLKDTKLSDLVLLLDMVREVLELELNNEASKSWSFIVQIANAMVSVS